MPVQQAMPLPANGSFLDVYDESLRNLEANRFGIIGEYLPSNFTWSASGVWTTPTWSALSFQTSLTGNVVLFTKITNFSGGSIASGSVMGLSVDGGAATIVGGSFAFGGYWGTTLAGNTTHTVQIQVNFTGTGPWTISGGILLAYPL